MKQLREILLIVGMAVLIAYAGRAIVIRAETHAKCLAAGYVSASFDWRMNGYCIKRVDQTDFVIPARDLR